MRIEPRSLPWQGNIRGRRAFDCLRLPLDQRCLCTSGGGGEEGTRGGGLGWRNCALSWFQAGESAFLDRFFFNLRGKQNTDSRVTKRTRRARVRRMAVVSTRRSVSRRRSSSRAWALWGCRWWVLVFAGVGGGCWFLTVLVDGCWRLRLRRGIYGTGLDWRLWEGPEGCACKLRHQQVFLLVAGSPRSGGQGSAKKVWAPAGRWPLAADWWRLDGAV